MKKFFIYTLTITLSLSRTVFAQCPTADFNSVASACLNQKILFSSNGSEASKLEWDFCDGSILNTPTAFTVGTLSGVSTAFDITTQIEDNLIYGFVLSTNNKLFRVDYGSTLGSVPLINDLGNFDGLITSPQGIGFYEEGGNHYALVTSASGSVARLSFGSSILNTPITTLIPGISGLTDLRHLKITTDGISIYAFITGGGSSGVVTILDFGTSILNDPAIRNIPFASTFLTGIDIVHECNNWYILTVGFSSGLHILEFGASLTNTPTISTNSSITSPVNISIVKSLGQYYAFIPTSGSLLRLSFGTSINNVPVVSNLGGFGLLTLDIAFEVVVIGSKYSILAINYGDNKLIQLNFAKDCETSSNFFGITQPELSYHQAGTFYVTHTVYDSDGLSSSVTKPVIVSSLIAPDIDFTNDNSCVNSLTTFTASEKLGTTLTAWDWDLDAGQTSSLSNPSYNYPTIGEYTVSLDAGISNGCHNRITKTINIYNPPTSSFTLPTNDPLCTNQQFTFPNTSTFDVGSSPSWEWFVNGTSVSTAKDLKQSFSSATAQTVKLKASIPGCFTESSQVINSLLAGPQLGFTVAGMCEGDAVTFTNTTTDPVLGFEWDFGDSQSSTSTDASHNYTSHGNYTVSLQASNANGCQNTVTKNIVLYTKPQSDFSLSLPPFSCSGNVSQFNDLTANPTDSNIASWTWNFDDAGSAQNTSAQKNAQHTYSLAGDYNVALTTKTNRGCSGTIQKQVTIAQSPQANFTNTPACRDVPVVFTDTSTGTITSWYWQMDNTFYFVAQPKPTHIFTSSKTYPVSLTVTASNNCISVVNKNLVIPVPLVPSFAVEKNCTDQNTNFIDMTNSIADPIQAYDWQFANLGTGIGSPSQFTFATAGKYDVTMNATALSGCTYSATAKIDIVPGPVASFSASPETGVPPLEVQFNNTSENAKYYAWSFNDNSSSPTSIENSPKHTFVDFGEYVVDLTASNDLSCVNTISKIIKTVLPNKDIAIIALNTIKNDDGSLKVIATLKNNGNVVLQNLPLVADVSGFTSIRESVTGPIAPAATFNYTFTYEILLTKGLDFLCGDIQLDGDVNADDNKICTTLNDTFYLYAPYPNPVNATINLDWITPDVEPLQVEIYDAMSKLIATYHYQGGAGLNQADLSVEHLTNGIYVFRISTTTTSRIYKIAIAH